MVEITIKGEPAELVSLVDELLAFMIELMDDDVGYPLPNSIPSPDPGDEPESADCQSAANAVQSEPEDRIAEFIRIKQEIVDRVAAIKPKKRELFEAGVKDLFAKHPDLHQIHWRQHTPSWNDGDPCRFGVGSIFVNNWDIEHGGWDDLEEEDEEDKESAGDWRLAPSSGSLASFIAHFESLYGYGDVYDSEKYQQLKDAVDAVPSIAETKTFLELFDEQDYEDMYGDGAKVTITREGVETEEYYE